MSAVESTPEFVDSQSVREYLLGLQQRIVDTFEKLDGKPFLADTWEKPAGAPLGGGGLTRIIEDGNLLERGGVGFSHVIGSTLPPSATAQRPELAGRGFEAMGVSLVFHPRNPYVPTVHMNVRFFIAKKAGEPDVYWFGGGMDLTPYYATEEDARHFHATCKQALMPFGADKHPRFKKWCDEYFFLKHRNEPRGIGGVFFDDFHELGFDQSFAHDAGGRRCLPRCLRPDRRTPSPPRVRSARTRVPGVPTWSLCRIQPCIRPWHAVRTAIRRAHRVDPDVIAAGGALEVRLASRARQPGGAAVHGLPATARMGLMAVT